MRKAPNYDICWMLKVTSLLTLIIASVNLSFSQLAIYDTVSNIQKVEALSGPGVSFSNIQIDCPGGTDFSGNYVPQMPQFDGTLSTIGVDAGLIMSSGGTDSTLASQDDLITSWSALNPGDADLDLIVSPDNTNDACVVEFDLEMKWRHPKI